MSHKLIISAAANAFDVYGKDGKFMKSIVLVDSGHMCRNMQDVFHLLRELGCTLKPRTELGDNGQGFIDCNSRFHNRSEAYRIAIESGQAFNPEFILGKDRLDSSCIRHFPDDIEWSLTHMRTTSWCCTTQKDHATCGCEDSFAAVYTKFGTGEEFGVRLKGVSDEDV